MENWDISIGMVISASPAGNQTFVMSGFTTAQNLSVGSSEQPLPQLY